MQQRRAHHLQDRRDRAGGSRPAARLRQQPASPIRASTFSVGACGTASVVPATSCPDCAMNSRSTSPPVASFRSNAMPRRPFASPSARASRPRRRWSSPTSRGRPRISAIAASISRAHVAIGRHHAGPAQRQVLPRPGVVVVIADEPRQARRQRPGVARRPQPHVGRVEHALRGRRGHRRDQPLRQPRKVLARRQRLFAVRLLGRRPAS